MSEPSVRTSSAARVHDAQGEYWCVAVKDAGLEQVTPELMGGSEVAAGGQANEEQRAQRRGRRQHEHDDHLIADRDERRRAKLYLARIPLSLATHGSDSEMLGLTYVTRSFSAANVQRPTVHKTMTVTKKYRFVRIS